MKIVRKVLQILIMASAIIILNFNVVNADVESMGSDAKGFIEKGKRQYENLSFNIGDILDQVIDFASLLTLIGVGVLICVTTYLGIQYFISPPDKQGALKEKMIAILLSAVVIFGAYNIWKIVISIANNFDN